MLKNEEIGEMQGLPHRCTKLLTVGCSTDAAPIFVFMPTICYRALFK
jgi:hypothetical protein